MSANPGIIGQRALHALSIITFIILSVSSVSDSVKFSVIGPDQPIVVPPGEDAVLPCRLSPQISAERNLTVRWFRGNYLTVVHMYHNGKDSNEKQMAEYKMRTEIIKDGVSSGIVSLLIHNVRPSDSGRYTCFVDAGSFYDDTIVELKVAAVGSHPHINMEESQKEGIQLVCISSGWYPEPEVLWKDGNGENISSFSVVNTTDVNRQVHIKTIHIVKGNATKLSCCIKNSMLNECKESTISVSDSFIQSMSTCRPTRILIFASFTLLVVAFLSFHVYLFKKRARKLQEMSARIGTLSKELANLPRELDWRRTRYSVRVTLDPDTAHPRLVLSEDNRRVRGTGIAQSLPDKPSRFTDDSCVLGTEGFTSGRHSWELELLQEGGPCMGGWWVGVAGESVNRTNKVLAYPEGGVWAVEGYKGHYWGLTSPPSPLTLREHPRKLGVYLDYEEGRVSIYNADTMEQLYNFTNASLTHRVFPLFNFWRGAEMRLL